MTDGCYHRNLFVAKLPRNLTDNDLLQIFSEYEPESAKIMLDATTGKSKGFGFVLFPSEETGKTAFDALNRQHVNAHGHSFSLRIFPSKHDGKAATEEKRELFIRNIPSSLSRPKVEQFLRSFGNVTYCSMRVDNHSGNVWVVYSEYDTVQSAAKALKSMHGKRFFRQSIPVIAKYADSDELKKERRKRRETNKESPSPNINQEAVAVMAENPPAAPAAPHNDHFSPLFPHYGFASASSSASQPGGYYTGFSNGGNPFTMERNHFVSPPLHSTQEVQSDHMDHLDHFSTPIGTATPELSFREFGTSTPVSSHSRSGSIQYRHNPYAPVTPISSARSSVSSIQMNASSSQVTINFQRATGSSHYSGSGYQNHSSGFSSNHFSSKSRNFLEV